MVGRLGFAAAVRRRSRSDLPLQCCTTRRLSSITLGSKGHPRLEQRPAEKAAHGGSGDGSVLDRGDVHRNDAKEETG